MIELNNIYKRFGNIVVIENLSYRFESGKIYSISAENGTGKSTLFKLILGFIKLDSGRIKINSRDTLTENNPYTGFGFYFPDEPLFDFLRPHEFISLLSQNTAHATNITLFREILSDNKLIRELSSGNKAKIALLAALLKGTRILILDEPFAYLDMKSREKLISTLVAVNREMHITILITTHDTIDFQSENYIPLSLTYNKLEKI